LSRREKPQFVNHTAFDAVIFDMDGVITDTARLHEAAWKRLFDEFLSTQHSDAVDVRPFSPDDYRRHVDGRARIDGVEAFLASRGVHVPRGAPQDTPDTVTAWGLANRKNDYFLEAAASDGIEAIPSSVAFAARARALGLRTALVTASRNRSAILRASRTDSLFDAHVDGDDAAALGPAGKPAPDMFVEAARRLGIEPARAVVVEDALAGAEAARRGGFGLVVGLDRSGQLAAALQAHGADPRHDTTGYLYNPAHRWHYYRDMTPGEVLVFKAHDTDSRRSGRGAAQRVHRSHLPAGHTHAGECRNPWTRALRLTCGSRSARSTRRKR
jgi:beta-phosphoglucomutase family hydrolase